MKFRSAPISRNWVLCATSGLGRIYRFGGEVYFSSVPSKKIGDTTRARMYNIFIFFMGNDYMVLCVRLRLREHCTELTVCDLGRNIVPPFRAETCVASIILHIETSSGNLSNVDH